MTFGTRWPTRLLKVPVTESEMEAEQRAVDEVDQPSTTGDWPGVGSPVARAWPATFLLPTVTTFQSSYTYANSFPHEYIKDGSLAFNLVLRLLQFSNQKPQRLAMLREDPECYAAELPPWIFDPAWPNQKHFSSASDLLYFQSSLKVLRLDFGCINNGVGRTVELCPRLNLLRSFLENASELEWLCLKLPSDLTSRIPGDIGCRLYTLEQIFPFTSRWYLPKLTGLRLGYVAGSFMRFAQLLFLRLPRLKGLSMHND